MRVPRDWNVVKIEGNARAGHVLLADLSAARLGVRWATVGRRDVDADAAVRAALRAEVGQLAADEAIVVAGVGRSEFTAHLLYEDPEPPGRDVWIGFSTVSRRLIQLSYQASRRDRVLRDDILPTLIDQNVESPQRWSVLDLSCESPPGYALESHQLSAGDLRLTFAGPNHARLTVRQIGPATLALSRQPIERWLAGAVETGGRVYRADAPSPLSISADAGPLTGLQIELRKRRRAWLRRLPSSLTTCVLHDEARDRLLLLQASDATQLAAAARSVGWAAREAI